MKNFPKVSSSCAVSGIFAVLVICVLGIAVSACAEPERYDFPKEGPIKFVKPLMPVLTEYPSQKSETHKINEARLASIAALLRRYNKKLTDEKARDYANLIIQV